MAYFYVEKDEFAHDRLAASPLSGVSFARVTFIGDTLQDLRLLQEFLAACRDRGERRLSGIQSMLLDWGSQRVKSQGLRPDRPAYEIKELPSFLRGTAPGDLIARWQTDLQNLPPGKEDELDNLYLATELAAEEWTDSDAEAGMMFMFCLHADRPYPGDGSPFRFAEFEEPVSAFLLTEGSLLAALVAAARAAAAPGRWVLGIFAKIGASILSRRVIGDWFTDSLRKKAAASAKLPPLPKLDDAWLNHKPNLSKQTLIIFLHGLFSTDAATFDGFRMMLDAYVPPQVRACFQQRYAMLGWPHDTLISIGDNATELADVIRNRVGVDGPDIAFVCHSRGGLVARMTAALLIESDVRWRDKLRGAVTFGTPHKGAELAEAPAGAELAAYLLLYSGAGQLKSLVYLLIYLQHQAAQASNPQIQGMRDLCPLGSRFSQFLADLPQREQLGTRRIPLFAVGGNRSTSTSPSGWWQRVVYAVGHQLVSQHIGSVDHDLVVRLDSTLPTWLDPGHRKTVSCDHSGYFDSVDARTYEDELRAFLEWIDFATVAADCLRAQSATSAPVIRDDGDHVIIGGIRLKKKI